MLGKFSHRGEGVSGGPDKENVLVERYFDTFVDFDTFEGLSSRAPCCYEHTMVLRAVPPELLGFLQLDPRRSGVLPFSGS
jgi:hypothetical protein